MPSELSLEQRAQKRAQREVTRTRFVKEFPATTIAEMNLARQVEELREALINLVDTIEDAGGHDENGDVFDIREACAILDKTEVL